MKMYNSDGSEGLMCGNGIRCVGKYVYEYGIIPKHHITVETMSGIKSLYLETEGKQVKSVTVNMGYPEIKKDIPIKHKGYSLILHPVSMGNPHAVVWVTDPERFPVETMGAFLEHAPCFPDGCNIEFAHILSRKHIQMRVWERGSQETLSWKWCMRSICISICIGTGRGEVTVELLGGGHYVFIQRMEEKPFI